MNKKKTATMLALLSLALTARADAISLESRAVIEEIRNRLNRIESPASEPEITEVVSEKYVPGQDLRAALARLRSNLYQVQKPEKTAPMPIRASVTLNFTEDYEPGALLSRSLDKIRSQREINRMIKLINAVKSMPKLPPVPDSVQIPDKTGSEESVEKATEETGEEPLADYVEKEPASDNRKNSSAELLRQVRMKLDRRLVHNDRKMKDSESETTVEPVKAKREEEDLNSEISTYEFKMPSNYRIIVR